MSKTNSTIDDKQYLLEAPLPEATPSYTVIPHELVINTVTRLIQERGFSILKEVYKYNTGANVACGIYYLNHEKDPDMGMMFTWTNSYDKTVRFKCFVGAYVKINDNVIVSNTDGGMYKRKHTGTADTEVEETVAEQLSSAISYYDELVRDKEKMVEITVSDSDFGALIGRLYLTDRMISTEQISIVSKELKKPSYTYACGKNCLWTLYNYVLTAVIKCHPNKWAEQQRMVHIWFKNEFQIGDFTPVATSKHKDEHVPLSPAFESAVNAETVIKEKPPVFLDRTGNARKTVEDIVPAETKEVTAPVESPVVELPPAEETIQVPLKEEPVVTSVVEEEDESEEAEETAETAETTKIDINKADIFSLLPNAEIGNVIQVNGEDYIIIDENETHFSLELLNLNEEAATVEEGPLPFEEETMTAVLPVVEKSPLLPPKPNKLQAIAPSISYKDIQIIAPEPEPVSTAQDDEIRKMISQEILNLYGTVKAYTYTRVANQYNVVLETNETVCLAAK